jgi:hypothetical protein
MTTDQWTTIVALFSLSLSTGSLLWFVMMRIFSRGKPGRHRVEVDDPSWAEVQGSIVIEITETGGSEDQLVFLPKTPIWYIGERVTGAVSELRRGRKRSGSEGGRTAET